MQGHFYYIFTLANKTTFKLASHDSLKRRKFTHDVRYSVKVQVDEYLDLSKQKLLEDAVS